MGARSALRNTTVIATTRYRCGFISPARETPDFVNREHAALWTRGRVRVGQSQHIVFTTTPITWLALDAGGRNGTDRSRSAGASVAIAFGAANKNLPRAVRSGSSRPRNHRGRGCRRIADRSAFLSDSRHLAVCFDVERWRPWFAAVFLPSASVTSRS